MEITLIEDKDAWNGWLCKEVPHPSFLQSWEWGELVEETNQKVERLAVVHEDKVMAQAQLMHKKWYVFAPKAPYFSKEGERYAEEIYQTLIRYIKEQKKWCWKIEPRQSIPNLTYRIHEVQDLNPLATLVLDVSNSEEELLARMHQKTRYNIHLAEKKGLRVSFEKDFDSFWNLIQQTGSRDKFPVHPEERYRSIISSPLMHQITVYLNEAAVATGCFFGFGDTLFYVYGGSDHTHRQYMGPHLVQWKAIQLAKQLGYARYDFFGISPRATEGRSELANGYAYDPAHRYEGVTRFKLGFGGKTEQDPGTFDIILSPLQYTLYQIGKKLRQKI